MLEGYQPGDPNSGYISSQNNMVDQGIQGTIPMTVAEAQAHADAAGRTLQSYFPGSTTTDPNANPYDPNLAAYGSAYASAMSSYQAAQVALDKQKIQFSYDQLAQQDALEKQKLQEDQAMRTMEAQQKQREADANTVENFTKDLMAEKGPKDPYGYLFNSRGFMQPQGYAPTDMPLAQPVQDMYKQQGISLQDAQKSIVGSAGPSFIQGYLGGLSPAMQQGPMGFENSSQFQGVAPGSQQQSDMMKGLNSAPAQPPKPQQPTQSPQQQLPGQSIQANQIQPIKMASGGVVDPSMKGTPMSTAGMGGSPMGFTATAGGNIPGYAPGQDTVPAMLSPGEGVLTPDTVRALGGPQAVNSLNSQHFAAGGVAQPLGVLQLHQGDTPQSLASYWGQHGFPGITAQGLQASNTNTPFAPGNTWDIWGAGQGPIAAPPPANPTPIMQPQQQPLGVVASNPIQMGSGQHQSFKATNPINTFGGPPVLHGGVLNAPPPPNPPPMNLNMLDPSTRGLVNQYGVPQIPSDQAWNSLTPTEQSAYQSYVDTVAGGNSGDLLSQMKLMDQNQMGLNPQGFTQWT